MSIVEDQVSYARSLGIQAAYLGESKTKDREILNGWGAFSLLYGSPESLTGGQEIQGNVLYGVLPEEFPLQVHTAVH